MGSPQTNENNVAMESDAVVFNRIYRRHVAGLMHYASKFVTREEASDIVHDVFTMLWRQKKLTIPADEIRFFLYRCVLNACKNRVKHLCRINAFNSQSASELQLAEIDFLEAQIKHTSDEYLLNKVYRSLEILPPKCRRIFEEVYLHQRKCAEVAEELNLSRRTVEAQLYKALKLLRDALLIVGLVYVLSC